MFALKRMRIIDVYRNCPKSMLKYDTVLKCLMSNDSTNVDDVIDLMKKKDSPKKKIRKLQVNNANKLFNLVKGDDNLKNVEVVEEKPVTNLASKINELIKTAEAVPKSSSKSAIITPVGKTPRKVFKSKNDTKEKFLENAKQVALTLGVDVKMTQNELLKAFESIEGETASESEISKKSSSDNYKFKARKQLAGETSEKLETQNFFGDMAEPSLNIFKKNVGEKESEPILEVWNELKKITLLHSTFRPPRNYFEELINWTNQRKLWRFPIDNDQDWHEEIGTDFADHVFLDKHLEPWCPRTGPIRHFMELVTTGLSKNPYLSAEKKKKHILWYRDYFQAKSALLTELGVLDPQVNTEAVKSEAGENKL